MRWLLAVDARDDPWTLPPSRRQSEPRIACPVLRIIKVETYGIQGEAARGTDLLQREGAESFDQSWQGPVGRIAAKSTLLKKGDQTRAGQP